MSAFTDELEQLVRETALEIVAQSLSANGLARAPASKRRASPGRGRPATKPSGDARERILAYVKAHPGARSEVVRAALGIPRGQWIYALNGLIAARQVKRTGVKRASTLSTR